MIIEGADYFVRYLQLPVGIYAFVMLNDDGTYSIYLDPRRDCVHQREDFDHEIKHIIRGDLHNDTMTVVEIEDEM